MATEAARLNVRAILIGFLVDLVGTSLFGLLLSGALAAAGQNEQQLAQDAGYLLGTLGLGLSSTALGSYVAARLARAAELNHAFVVGVLSTVSGFASVFGAPAVVPFWYEAAGLLLTLPAAIAGGSLRLATRPRSTS